MANTIVCPACQRKLRVPDHLIGQQVKCPSCQETFTAEGESEAAPPPPPRPEPPAFEEPEDRPSRRSRRDEPADEDRPSRRSRRDEDEDDRPSRRSRRDEYDDEDRPSRRSSADKPGAVQAIAIMTLIGGIYALVYVAIMVLASAGVFCACLLWPGTYYGIVVGILAIIKGAALLGQNARNESPPTTAAILMIINFVNADLVTGILGIVILVLLNDPKTKNWYRG